MNYIVKIKSREHFKEVRSVLIELGEPIESHPPFKYRDYECHIYFNVGYLEWCVCSNKCILLKEKEINIDQLRTILTKKK
jgi:hypothetical protein